MTAALASRRLLGHTLLTNLTVLTREKNMRNVDVKVSVDVRVDPAGVILLLASAAMALFFFKSNKANAKSVQ